MCFVSLSSGKSSSMHFKPSLLLLCTPLSFPHPRRCMENTCFKQDCGGSAGEKGVGKKPFGHCRNTDVAQLRQLRKYRCTGWKKPQRRAATCELFMLASVKAIK